MHNISLSRILVTLALILVVLVVYDIGRQRSSDVQAAADAPFHVVESGNAVAAPNFTLPTDIGGKVHLTSATNGKPVVLDFWATWCGPCNAELPLLNNVYSRYKSQGVKFYGIDSDASAAQVRHFFSQQHVGFPMLIDDGTVAQSYDVSAIPHVVVIDGKGLVRAEDIGFDPETQQDLSSCLDRLLKEQ